MAKDFSKVIGADTVTDYIKQLGKTAGPTAQEIKKADGENPTPSKKNRSQSKLESGKPLKDKRINLVLTEKQYNDLKAKAEAQGLSYSAYIRQLISKDLREGK